MGKKTPSPRENMKKQRLNAVNRFNNKKPNRKLSLREKQRFEMNILHVIRISESNAMRHQAKDSDENWIEFQWKTKWTQNSICNRCFLFFLCSLSEEKKAKPKLLVLRYAIDQYGSFLHTILGVRVNFIHRSNRKVVMQADDHRQF